MQVSHAIHERRSTRAFTSEAVPSELVKQLLEVARWAPSWANSQAWNIFVVTGEALERLKATMTERAESDVPAHPDLPMPPREWPEYLSARMTGRPAASEAPDGQARPATGPSVWEFWGAPCVLLLAIDELLEPRYACLDAGILAQTICLAAEDRGLSTCIMATAVRHADVLHELIPAAENMRFVVGIAIGQADHTAVVNRGERKRVDLDELVTWID